MKKLLLAFLMLITCFGMTSCNAFFAEEDDIVITNIYTEFATNNKGEQGLNIIIEYGNEDRLPDKFFVPNGKQGETGLTGNGIENIKTSVNEKTKETTVTITFTDETKDPISYTVPAGVSLKGVITEPQPDGSSKVQFEFSDGTKSESITLPKGEKGDGIEYFKPGEDLEDGSKVILIKLTNQEEPITITIPKGNDGNGIQSIAGITLGDQYILQILYKDGSIEQVPFNRPNSWITGSSRPGDDVGLENDFFFDTAHKIIYSKEGGTWSEVVRLETTTPQMCTVTFDVNDQDGYGVSATLIGQKVRQVKEGTYFGMKGEKELPEPSRDGFEFGGWYLVNKPTAVNGRFTDTTPVFGDVTLYANWIKLPEAQA